MPGESGLVLGAVLSLAIAEAARRGRALTADGAAAAVVVGTVVFGLGGIGAAVLLGAFFVTSSLLTRWGARRKPDRDRRGRRASQVLANGSVAAAASVWWAMAPTPQAAAALAGALAAATADTWATEIGLLSPERPRLITTGRPVPAGTSGAITARGTAWGMAGAACIAALASLLLGVAPLAAWLGGVAGMTVDSLLGATLERRTGWMTNDAVNLLATVSGAALAVVLEGVV